MKLLPLAAIRRPLPFRPIVHHASPRPVSGPKARAKGEGEIGPAPPAAGYRGRRGSVPSKMQKSDSNEPHQAAEEDDRDQAVDCCDQRPGRGGGINLQPLKDHWNDSSRQDGEQQGKSGANCPVPLLLAKRPQAGCGLLGERRFTGKNGHKKTTGIPQSVEKLALDVPSSQAHRQPSLSAPASKWHLAMPRSILV